MARDLIGCVLAHDYREGRLAVRLVEVEAYRGEQDPGSHGYLGANARNRTMFGPPGRLYVYFTYGMHWCANVVCGKVGVCEAVLLRAGEPLEGIEAIRAKRGGIANDRLLASGPARLAQALGITKEHDGTALLRGGTFFIAEDALTHAHREKEIAQTVRVGLSPGRGADLPWRFLVPGHPHASRGPLAFPSPWPGT